MAERNQSRFRPVPSSAQFLDATGPVLFWLVDFIYDARIEQVSNGKSSVYFHPDDGK